MDPEVTQGQRKLPTRLDLAGLDDIGWDVLSTSASITGSHVYGDDGSYPVRLVVSGSTPGRLTVNVGAAAVTNVPPTLSQPAAASAIQNVPLQIIDFATFSDPGFGPAEKFAYRIDWNDGTAATTGNATIDRAGSPNVLTLGSINASHTFAAPGTYRGTVTLSDDDGGTASRNFTVSVTPPPRLELRLSNSSVAESAGTAAVQLTVTASNFPSSEAILVQLASSDTSEARLPPSVTIPAGSNSTLVNIDAVDDNLLDGSVTVTLSGSTAGVAAATIALVITDHETLTLRSNRVRVRENAGAGAAVLTLSRSNTDRQQPLTVSLSSSDASELTLPATVTIPAGAASIDVGLTAVDDTLLDGVQIVSVDASAAGYVGGGVSLEVLDHEPLQLVSSVTTLTEGSPINSTTRFTIQLPSPAPAGGVSVALAADADEVLLFPATVLIPAGSDRAEAIATVIDNSLVRGNREIQITASSLGYEPSAVVLNVLDDDRSAYTNFVNRFDVTGDNEVSPLDVLAVINAINAFGSGSVDRISPAVGYIDVTGNGLLEVLDVLAIVNFINARRRI